MLYIAQILGTTPSQISEILSGKRGLTIELAKGLYNNLNIDPKLILSDQELGISVCMSEYFAITHTHHAQP